MKNLPRHLARKLTQPLAEVFSETGTDEPVVAVLVLKEKLSERKCALLKERFEALGLDPAGSRRAVSVLGKPAALAMALAEDGVEQAMALAEVMLVQPVQELRSRADATVRTTLH